MSCSLPGRGLSALSLGLYDCEGSGIHSLNQHFYDDINHFYRMFVQDFKVLMSKVAQKRRVLDADMVKMSMDRRRLCNDVIENGNKLVYGLVIRPSLRDECLLAQSLMRQRVANKEYVNGCVEGRCTSGNSKLQCFKEFQENDVFDKFEDAIGFCQKQKYELKPKHFLASTIAPRQDPLPEGIFAEMLDFFGLWSGPSIETQ
eukprot:GEMP01048629.1.p1 GENE.GEMP01048629.1~~GEMP01048629.1.p1  ORF type:complete len:202 (+),score=30.74 GEMP01048629.1:118-723(+)